MVAVGVLDGVVLGWLVSVGSGVTDAIAVGVMLGVGVMVEVGVAVGVGDSLGVLLTASTTTVGWGVSVVKGVGLGVRVGASVGVTSGTDRLQAASANVSRIIIRLNIRTLFAQETAAADASNYRQPYLYAIDDCTPPDLRRDSGRFLGVVLQSAPVVQIVTNEKVYWNGSMGMGHHWTGFNCRCGFFIVDTCQQ
jgi:hypothetical protein